eukprot:14859902-Heterocapsa_arctica.AAC.1
MGVEVPIESNCVFPPAVPDSRPDDDSMIFAQFLGEGCSNYLSFEEKRDLAAAEVQRYVHAGHF